MDQECEKCGKRFQLAKLETVMELSDYPVQSRAIYCPYCGHCERNRKSAAPDLAADNARLREVLAELVRAADPKTNMSDIPLLDALSLARAHLAGGE